MSNRGLNILNDEMLDDNRDIILQHILNEGRETELTEKQKDLKSKYIYADEMMRDGRYSHRQIAIFIKEKYQCSIASARNYMRDAQYIFGTVGSYNKSYLWITHLDKLDKMIDKCQELGMFKEAAALMAERGKTIARMKDESANPPAPAAIIFNITNGGSLLSMNFNAQDAERVARERLQGNEHIEDADFKIVE